MSKTDGAPPKVDDLDRQLKDGIKSSANKVVHAKVQGSSWVYANPKGPEHNTLNCSIADLELTVERDGATPRSLSLEGGAAYEFGLRETDHGIPLQPYPDG